MGWSKDFSQCPAGSQPFLAKREAGKKVKYAVVTKSATFYAGTQFVANCVIEGVGKGFLATHWRPLPRDDERADFGYDVMRKALMEIAAHQEPKARQRAQTALDQLRGFAPAKESPVLVEPS